MENLFPVQKNNRIVKLYFRSAKVLLRGLLELGIVGFSIGIIVTMSTIFDDMISMIARNQTVDYSIVNPIKTASLISLYVSLIPMLLIAAAYLIIYFKSRSDSPESQPDAGFTILNIFAILKLIGAVLTAAGSILGAVIPLFSKNYIVNTGTYIAIGSVIVSSLVIVAVAILYKVYIGSVNKSAKTAELSNSGAKAYGVISVIKAISGGFTVLSTLALLIARSALFDLIIKETSNENDKSIFRYLSDKSTAFILMAFFIVLAAFVINILDAAIAFGFARHIETARMMSEDDSDYPDDPGDYQPAYQNDPNAYQSPYGYSPDDMNTVADPYAGYGDDGFNSGGDHQ